MIREGMCLMFLLALGCGPGAEEYAALRAHADRVLGDARSTDDAMRAAIVASMSAPAAGQCTPSMVQAGREHIDNYVSTTLEQLPSTHTAQFARVNSWVTQHRSYFDGQISLDQESLDGLNRDLDAFAPYPYEIVMVQRRVVAPRVAGGGFTGGTFEGRLVVWNVAAGHIECSVDESPGVMPSTVDSYGDAARDVAGAMVDASTADAWQRAGLGTMPRLGASTYYH